MLMPEDQKPNRKQLSEERKTLFRKPQTRVRERKMGSTCLVIFYIMSSAVPALMEHKDVRKSPQILYAQIHEERDEFQPAVLNCSASGYPEPTFLTDDKEEEVTCTWEIRAREDHFAALTFQFFRLPKEEDCLSIHDGSDASGKLLAKLCGQDVPSNEPYKSSGRSLFITFRRCELCGYRQFIFKYFAVLKHTVPKGIAVKDSRSMIAAVTSSAIAFVALCYLTIKFTHNCRPCRKKWCHDRTTDDQAGNRELRPLAPEDLMPCGVRNTREDNLQIGYSVTNPTLYSYSGITDENGTGNVRILGSIQCLGSRNGNQNARAPGVLEDADETRISATPSIDTDADLRSPSANEPPPSYDSLFGGNKNVGT